MENRLSKRIWLNIILFSFMGGVAWNLENMYFNTFLYSSIYGGVSARALEGVMSPTTAISRMVAFSAAVAVLTTFVMGTLSEKMKKRKAFISVGYIIWGAVTAAFGFISRDNVAAVFGLSDEVKILSAAVWAVIIMDMIMTFMGSTSNDSAFNAWVTDVTNPVVRPKVETVLMIGGLVASGVVMGLGSLAQGGVVTYKAFFIGIGAFVSLIGVLGLFTLEEPKIKGEKSKNNYWADLFYGFRPSVIRDNVKLYLVLVTVGIYNIAVQVFFPYLFVYLEKVILKDVTFDGGTIAAAAVAVAVAVAGIVLLLRVAGKNKLAAYLPTIALFVIGLFVLSTSTNIFVVLAGVAPTVIGYAVLQIELNASVRDFIPEDKVGLFQGIRMIFMVLLPMVVGPFIGDIACRTSNFTIEEYGVEKIVPSTSMFLWAAVVGVLAFIPIGILAKKKAFAIKTDKKEKTEA